MNNLIENIATSGELSNATSDMRILLYMFMFTFIIVTTCSIIGYLKGIGK